MQISPASAPALALVAASLLLFGCARPRYDLASSAPSAVGPGSHAVGVVRVQAPWYAPRFVIAGKFRDAVPEYEAKAELETKFFTIADDGRFGGVYFWSTRAAAEGFYTDSWRRGIRERRGVDPDLVVFDAPYLVVGRTVVHGDAIGSRSISYGATVTLVLGKMPVPAASASVPDDATRPLAEALEGVDGLVRGATLVGSGRIGFVALWATRGLAEAAVSGAGPRERGLVASNLVDPEVTFFDAPVLVDASLRAAGP
jgi:hypothetical protein